MKNVIMKVFNCYEWQETGDIGNNSQFYQEAEILETYRDKHGRFLANVKFTKTGRISKGHFVDVMIPC